ncbi:MAG: hypothetical protein H6714_02825 [Myxococcales bacterium]|nr:hypothetical protein [Myxococcales bacterium]
MNLEPGPLIASFIIGSIGLVAFMYGKRQKRVPQLAVGLVLMVYPYFITNLWLVYLIAALLLALLWIVVKSGW